METADVVVIGSGIGGLCCAALLARYGFQVVVCESHSLAGGEPPMPLNGRGFTSTQDLLSIQGCPTKAKLRASELCLLAG